MLTKGETTALLSALYFIRNGESMVMDKDLLLTEAEIKEEKKKYLEYLNSQMSKVYNGEHDVFCISEIDWIIKAQTKKFIDKGRLDIDDNTNGKGTCEFGIQRWDDKTKKNIEVKDV